MNLAALDADLVREAVGGSSRAFSRLVERHQGAVRGFLRRTCGDWAEADDLAQETFLTALERLGGLREGASVRAWLCGIAWRKLQSRRRSWFRGARRDHAWSTETGAAPPSEDDRRALARAMATLSAEEQAAVALCLAAEFTQAEAAETLGLTLAKVKAHVARGRARLLLELKVDDDRD